MAINRLSTQRTSDRISDMPLHIIHKYILSSLPDKEVKFMSSLSKTWHHIIMTYPYLVFNDPSNPESIDKTINKYVNYVSDRLHRFHDYNEPGLKIKRLTIPINNLRSKVAQYLDYWIKLALLRGVEEFNLQIGDPPAQFNTLPYDLPHALFAPNKSIKVAMFKGYCSLLESFPSNTISRCGPHSDLMKLCLDNVLLDEQTLSSIISTCPLIEELSILSCPSIHCFRISNLHNLKTLRISLLKRNNNYIIDINAPSLQSLNVYGCHERLELEINAPNLLSVVYKGYNLPLSPLTHYVKGRWNISLNSNRRVEDFLVELSNFGSKVNHIEYLNLHLREDTQSFSFEEMNKRAIQSVANLNHLKMCVFCKPNTVYPDLLDGVLMSFHPRTLSFTLGYNRDYNSNKIDNCNIMKHILKTILCHRDFCLCSTLTCSWIHHLEDVTYVTEGERKEQRLMDENYIPEFCREIKFKFKW